MKTNLIIFDLDGTLLDTIDDITDAINRALYENGLSTVTVEECKYMVGSGAKILIERAVKDRMDLFDSIYASYMAHYERLQANKTKPYDGIKEILSELRKLGIRLAILSNKPHEDTLRVVERYFGLDSFDVVMGKKPNNRIKPSIDGCIEIMVSLGISSNILYVGDTAVDMMTAKNAGYTSIGVTWGFRKKEELVEATYLIDHPKEIVEIVRSLS